MKNIIIALFVLFASVFTVQAQAPGEWVTDTFSAGDTTATFSVAKANLVLFTIADSSMTGTDTLAIYFQSPSATTNTLYSQIAVHDLAQTTQTTNVTVVSPGNGTTKTYVYTSEMHGGLISGTFFIQRQNTRTGEAVYAPKTRMAFRYTQ
jgi:hypothetical protein